MTLRTAISRFLTQLEADGKSPLTIRVYRGELDRFSAWAGKREVGRIQPETIAKYLTSSASLVSPSGTKRSTRTVNRTRTVLRLLFSYLAERGTIRQSPARLLKNGRTDRPIPTVLTDSEVRQFVHALDAAAKKSHVGERDRVLFTLLLRSGMRLAAALALNVRDLNLAASVALSTGKHGRTQQVFLPKPVARLLKSHLADTRITDGAIFRNRSGAGPLSPRQAQYRFRALVDLAGIERPVTVHSLRHTFATNLRRRTGDLRVVQIALGHRSLGATEVYATVGAEEVQRAVMHT